tara:strand:- start:340 stop:567 length:228 start_codon:yes stop_codon:yes gene_type:complete
MPKLTETDDWVSALRTFIRDQLGNKNWQIRKGERDKKLEAYKNLDPMAKLAMNPPSPEAIAQARQEWGITGEPTY